MCVPLLTGRAKAGTAAEATRPAFGGALAMHPVVPSRDRRDGATSVTRAAETPAVSQSCSTD